MKTSASVSKHGDKIYITVATNDKKGDTSLAQVFQTVITEQNARELAIECNRVLGIKRGRKPDYQKDLLGE